MDTATPHSQTPNTSVPMAAKPIADGHEMLADLLGRDPDAMPEVLRELTMLRGAVESVRQVADHLTHRLAHVLAPPVPRDTVPPTQAFSIDSAVGHHVRDTYTDVSRIEDQLASILARLTV